MEFSNKLCKAVAETTTNHSSRSSKRTDILHTILKHEIERIDSRLNCKIEYRFEIETGTYTCDLVIFQEDGVVGCIPFKASMTNIKQNKANLQTAKLGEVLKLRDATSAPIAFFDIFPIQCPYYTKTGEQSKCERFECERLKKEQATLVRLCEKQGIPIHVFTLFAEYEYPKKGEVVFRKVADYSDMDRFYDFIRSLAKAAV
jgi:hypothetical protein